MESKDNINQKFEFRVKSIFIFNPELKPFNPKPSEQEI